MQVLVAASEATKSLDQKTLADYPHRAGVSTVLDDIDFGPDGEPPEPRQLFHQYQGIVGNGLDPFKLPWRQVILYRPEFKSGEFKYPYAGIRR